MTEKSIAIIGAGIAGLSAGCYGQMNGYQTRIFELHDKPGGLCTSWKRKGYTFDGCIHWLVGSKPGSSMHQVWQELGAAQGRQIVNHQEFIRFEGDGGKTFVLYTDLDVLERHMKDLAPADGKLVERFCGAARRLTRLDGVMDTSDSSAGLLGRIKAGLRMLPLMPTMMKYSRTTMQDFAARFSDPFMREAFSAFFDMPDFPMIGLLMTLAWMNNGDAGYPIGGSLAFARAIERRYLDLGGEINYRSRVKRILVENDRAVGVRLEDGTEHRADVVISAADGHATIFDMLGGRYVDEKLTGIYDEWPIFAPLVYVSLGVNRDLSSEPHYVIYQLEDPITVAGEVRQRMGMKHYCYDPTLAPEGKSVVIVMFPSDYAYWKNLSAEPEQYDAEKKQIALDVIARLEQRVPGLGDQVEVVDVATPVTFERYTGNWQGSMEGWQMTTETISHTMGKGLAKTLPGLERFYMAGQWVEPGGGLPPAATSGRSVIEMICQGDGRAFTAQPTADGGHEG